MRYIDAEKLTKAIEDRGLACSFALKMERLDILALIDELQQEQPNNMIQWTGNNLKEVIGFTGKSPRFGEWFKSWEEYENYVHTHNDILKLFCEDGSHYEVPVGVWIAKTPDGYNVPSVAKYIQQEQPEVDLERITKFSLAKELPEGFDKKWLLFYHTDSEYNSNHFHHLSTIEREYIIARHFYELGLNARKED